MRVDRLNFVLVCAFFIFSLLSCLPNLRLLSILFVPDSHLSPSNSGVQLQLNLLLISPQVPLFSHGFGRHGPASKKEYKKKVLRLIYG